MNRHAKNQHQKTGDPKKQPVGNDDSGSKTRKQLFAICIGLAIAILLVFRQTGRFEFVNFDDNVNIYENSHITGGLTFSGIAWAFTHSVLGHLVPMTAISHMLDWQLFGLWAGGHHLVNVLLHTASAILLFLILRQATGALWPSAFVAALFAIHPMRVESVAWVTERKDVLSGLFFMLTIGAYVRYSRAPFALRRYIPILFLFALGLMSKSMLVTLPFVLLLLDYWPLRRFGQSAPGRPTGRETELRFLILEKLPLLLLSASASLVTLVNATTAIVSLDTLPLTMRVSNALVSYVAYIGQMLYPAGLAAFYPFPTGGIEPWQVAGSAVLLAALSVAAIVLRRRRPWILVGWLWYLGMLAPVIGLIQSGQLARADRYIYLPHIGLYLIAAWALVEFVESRSFPRWIPAAAGATIVAVLMKLAYSQASVWENSESLWNHTIACAPASALAHYNLGETLSKQGRQDEAVAQWQQALKILPTHPLARASLALASLAEGRPAEAVEHYKVLLRAQPRSAETHTDFGIALQALGKPDEALAQFEIALSLDGTSIKARDLIAWILATCPQASLRNGRKAVELAEQADQLSQRRDPMVIDTLAAAYAEAGRFPEAIQTARRALHQALTAGNTQFGADIQARIALYEGKHPYREAPNPATTAPKLEQ